MRVPCFLMHQTLDSIKHAQFRAHVEITSVLSDSYPGSVGSCIPFLSLIQSITASRRARSSGWSVLFFLCFPDIVFLSYISDGEAVRTAVHE